MTKKARLRALARGEEKASTDTERHFVYYWSRREELRRQHPDGSWILCIGSRSTGPGSWELAVAPDLESLFEYAETNKLEGNTFVCLGYEFEPPPDLTL